MPVKKMMQERQPQPPHAQEELDAGPERPILEESADAEEIEQGRPYQSYVESELSACLQDNDVQSLVEQPQSELRTVAMSVLGPALRKREGDKNPYMYMAHAAMEAVVFHMQEQRWTRRPLSDVDAGANYLDALVQLAVDADWHAKEIQFPDHPSVLYTRDARTREPIPRVDSYIRNGYLSAVLGSKLYDQNRIYPNTKPTSGSVHYTLEGKSGTPSVKINYAVVRGRGTRDFSGVKIHSESLEDLRAANMKIVALRRRGMGYGERARQIAEIRKPFGLA